jgi:hypothetical protein
MRDPVAVLLVAALWFFAPAGDARGAVHFTTTNAVWKIARGTNEASLPDTTAWRQPGFNDAAWQSAAAPVYYTSSASEPPFTGAGISGTVLSDMLNRYSCVFFRKTFVLANAAPVGSVTVQAACDDGFIAWLNGVEVLRVNMPAGAVAYNGFAASAPTEPVPVLTYTITNTGGLLRDGTNVLAVQGFNRTLNSTDFGFMAGLASAEDSVAPVVTSINPPPGSSLFSFAQVEAAFSEPVLGIQASDLRINGTAAPGMATLASNRFLFIFPQPATGTVNMAWAAGHGITDAASNAFAGGSWSYQFSTNAMAGAARISEFMAENATALTDEDGDAPDWIEIENTGATPVALHGWFLTDKRGNLRKWSFPPTNLAVNGHLVVHASGKDRRVPGAPLHTNFKLDSGGGYLALVRPDGTTVASEFSYGRQRSDVSFGLNRHIDSQPLVAPGGPLRLLVPTNDTAGTQWRGANEPFDDAAWMQITAPAGFDLSPVGSGSMPVGFWNFNDSAYLDTARDESGNGHHGTIYGASFTADAGGRTGLPGDRAMNFGPVNNGHYINVPDAVAGMFDAATAANQITFSLWVFGDATQPGMASAFWGADAYGGPGFSVHLPWTDSTIYWDTGGTGAGQRMWIAEPDATKFRGRWNHYVFLKNGSTKQIWQNGFKIAEFQNATYPLQTIRAFFIGSNNGGTWSYGGLIDDFAVWPQALTAAQIQNLAAGISPLRLETYNTITATDLAGAMWNVNPSAFIRIPFVAGADTNADVLLLRLRYDDGFVCWLNGVEVARSNAPATLAFDSSAPAKRVKPEVPTVCEIDLSSRLPLLRAGTNVLTIQALNYAASDADFLIAPELWRGRATAPLYFSSPTPGTTNSGGVSGLVEDTAFSVDRGFFFAPTNTVITTPTPGATIVCTFDGSAPSPTNGVKYPPANADTAPFAVVAVTNTTLLRAMAFKADCQPTDVDTHSYFFPAQVAKQTRPGWLPATWPDSSPADYDIDPRVVTNAAPGFSFTNALLAIPTISVVTESNSLFGASTGICANPMSSGLLWDRAASAEMIVPGGGDGFQVNCGVRIHGGASRYNLFTPKHSFSLLFRDEFGAAQLNHPLFTNSPVRRFDQLVLRACSSDSWPAQNGDPVNGEPWLRWMRDEASYMRDQWMRDAQLALGHPACRGIYVHLYLNGLYWGLYNLAERPDDSFAAEHLGGDKEEYDVISDFNELHSGTPDAWNTLHALLATNPASATTYQLLQGNNPDGTRDTNLPVHLDVTNLVDYMILHIYSGADDWPNHNWWGSRRRGPESRGFRFFTWDQEVANNSLQRQRISLSPYCLFADVNAAYTPAHSYAQLRQNAEFNVLFGDRVQKHLFNGGALTATSNIARWEALRRQVDAAVVAESARWGDFRRPAKPFTRESEWVSNQTWMVTTYWPSQPTNALPRFRNAGLYPQLGPPSFSQFGGAVPVGYALAITHTNGGGQMYFTTDNSDPRAVGGGLGAGAQLYASPLPLLAPAFIRARVRSGTNWSALVEAQFQTAQDFSALQLSELMYNPPKSGTNDGDDFEFLELRNTGAGTLNLGGLLFTDGITFTFSNGTALAPGAYLVLARDAAAYAAKYPAAPLHGLYSGKLANEGETVTLSHPFGGTLFSLAYDNQAPWPSGADNTGLSLQRMSTQAWANHVWNWVAAPPTPGSPPPADSVDADGDGMPDLWEIAHDLNPAVDDSFLDRDDDGFANRDEFLAGTNPDSASDALRLGIDAAWRVPAFMALSNRSYTVQFREGLAPGGWLNLQHVELAPSNRWVVLTNNGVSESPQRVFRLTTPRLP